MGKRKGRASVLPAGRRHVADACGDCISLCTANVKDEVNVTEVWDRSTSDKRRQTELSQQSGFPSATPLCPALKRVSNSIPVLYWADVQSLTNWEL